MDASTEVAVSIGQVKRDISELVNRVAYGGQHIILTSRGKPKAVLISVEDYERLKATEMSARQARWKQWREESDRLAQEILERRGGEPIDVDRIWEETRADLEARTDEFFRH